MATEKNKFNEDTILKRLKVYIDSTYEQHYSSGNIQTTEVTFDSGHGEGYGKKEGRNEKDLYKIIHYAVILLGQLADEDIRIRKQDVKKFEDHMQEGVE